MSEYICPNCGKPIYDDDALLCLYCGESLQKETGVFGKLKYSRPKTLTAVIILIIILSFILLLLR